MQKDFKLRPTSILLKQHSLKELRQIYESQYGEAPKKDKTHLQLVHELASVLSVEELFDQWPEKTFAHNTSFKFYSVQNVTDGKRPTKIKNGGKQIEKFFNAEAWNRITSQGYVPNELKDEGHLLQIARNGNKIYFLFASPGRAKEVIESLQVRYLVQPQFTIAVWNDTDSTLQVRGMDARDTALTKIREYLWVNDKIEPTFKQIYIDDKEKVKRLATLLNGEAKRGKFSSETAEVGEATFVSQPDKDLYETALVKQVEDAGYGQDSAGIDFLYQGESYTVWIGFSAGTFWLRSGNVTEKVIDYIEEKIAQI